MFTYLLANLRLIKGTSSFPKSGLGLFGGLEYSVSTSFLGYSFERSIGYHFCSGRPEKLGLASSASRPGAVIPKPYVTLDQRSGLWFRVLDLRFRVLGQSLRMKVFLQYRV